uniref:Uncharacterized protein n=1 Tax=Arundo donax TaxID=35708 RepID=A0A0A9FCQ5_ARUDO
MSIVTSKNIIHAGVLLFSVILV